MLMPKKVKYRKQQRGRRAGKAWRGSTLSFGDFGLKVLEPGYITGRQSESSHASRIAQASTGHKIRLARRTRLIMDAEKIRNTTDAELAHQLHEVNDELFQLKFRLRMGQTESLKKIRSLRRDLARIKTISRERQLGLNGPKAAEAKPEKKAAPVKAAAV